MRWTHVVCLLGVVALVGCGAGSGTVPVTGSVTLDGKPFTAATVTFSPQTEGGEAAVGLTDDAGKFSLTCQSGTGAKPGSYKVAITKIDPEHMKKMAPPGSPGTEGGMDGMDAAYEAAEEAGMDISGKKVEYEAAPDLVPQKYTNSFTSGFTAEVKAEGENNLPPFDMKSSAE